MSTVSAKLRGHVEPVLRLFDFLGINASPYLPKSALGFLHVRAKCITVPLLHPQEVQFFKPFALTSGALYQFCIVAILQI